jgi:hypothetical protein
MRRFSLPELVGRRRLVLELIGLLGFEILGAVAGNRNRLRRRKHSIQIIEKYNDLYETPSHSYLHRSNRNSLRRCRVRARA